MESPENKLGLVGIIPVVRIVEESSAIQIARSLLEGGLACAEVTFRTPQASRAMRIISEQVPNLLLGAGTITSCDQIDLAMSAGAKFGVSPGLNPKVLRYARDVGFAFFPGVSSASEIEAALELGYSTLKFFPAEQVGGADILKAFSGPFQQVKFIPTGGITLQNMNRYLALGNVLACGGSWMIPPEMIQSGNSGGIRELVRQTVHTMLDFQIAHVCINADNSQESAMQAKELLKLLGLEYRNGDISDFAGGAVEFVKGRASGRCGHIALSTSSIQRARFYLESRGYSFDETSVCTDESGNPRAIYLNQEFLGFSIHLQQCV